MKRHFPMNVISRVNSWASLISEIHSIRSKASKFKPTFLASLGLTNTIIPQSRLTVFEILQKQQHFLSKNATVARAATANVIATHG